MDKNDNKVLEFPQKKSLKKRLFDRHNEKKSILALSLASVFLVTLLMNDWLLSRRISLTSANENKNRFVANVSEENLKEQIDWEHQIARELSSVSATQKGLKANKPTLKDELIYGYLAGKFNVEFKDGKIISFERMDDNRDIASTVKLDELILLGKYKDLYAIPFDTVRLSPKQNTLDSVKIYELLTKSKQVVGQAEVIYDSANEIKKISLK